LPELLAGLLTVVCFIIRAIRQARRRRERMRRADALDCKAAAFHAEANSIRREYDL
jgi:hypothetical protein